MGRDGQADDLPDEAAVSAKKRSIGFV